MGRVCEKKEPAIPLPIGVPGAAAEAVAENRVEVSAASFVVVGSLVFASVFGGSLLAMIIRRQLPEHHWSAESKEVVKMGMGLISSLAALVLGLLIATAKGTYDAQSGAVNELAASYLLLDRVLNRYGCGEDRRRRRNGSHRMPE